MRDDPAGRLGLRQILVFSAAAEAGTGIAPMIAPSVVIPLLIRENTTDLAIWLGRFVGIALLSLGMACWPERHRLDVYARRIPRMLAYNTLVALLFAYYRCGRARGRPVVWPAAVLHVVIALLLWMRRCDARRTARAEAISAATSATRADEYSPAGRMDRPVLVRRFNFLEMAMTTRRTFVSSATLLASVTAPSTAAAQTAAQDCQAGRLLFVQTANAMSFDKATNKLTLHGVSPVTVFFSDRPERIAGNMKTSAFVPFWSQGKDSFLSDPPNADISVPSRARNCGRSWRFSRPRN